MMNTDVFGKLKVLVISLGSIGVRHLQNLKILGCGEIGVYRTLNRPTYKDTDLSDIFIHNDYDEALKNDYDAVIICNPTSMHMEYALKAAKAGCHMYIEKPCSDTLDGFGKLVKTVWEKRLKVMIGCQLRFHPNLVEIKRWLDQSLIGRILYVQVDTGEYLPGWHPWENHRNSYASSKELGGGVVLTLIHEIDFIHWLLGPLVVNHAIGGMSGALELDVEDNASAMLVARGNIPVMLHMDYLQQPPCRKMKIIGSKGVIEWDYYKGMAELTVEGAKKEISILPETWERNNLFLDIMADFLDSVCRKTVPRAPLEDGIEALRIALEIKTQIGFHT